MEFLLRYHWPGNVRELENAIERAVALGTGVVLTTESLPEQVQDQTPDTRDRRPETGTPVSSLESPLDLDAVVSRVERDLILEALRQAGGVQKRAAQALGLSFESFRYRMKKHGIDPGEQRPETGDRRPES
jgi:two-component system response regulator PilR (NtrC family)